MAHRQEVRVTAIQSQHFDSLRWGRSAPRAVVIAIFRQHVGKLHLGSVAALARDQQVEAPVSLPRLELFQQVSHLHREVCRQFWERGLRSNTQVSIVDSLSVDDAPCGCRALGGHRHHRDLAEVQARQRHLAKGWPSRRSRSNTRHAPPCAHNYTSRAKA